MQNKANVQRRDQQVAFDIGRVVLDERWQHLEDLELNIKSRRSGFSKGLEDLVQLRSGNCFGNNEALQTDNRDRREFDIFGAACNDEGIDKVGSLAELCAKVSKHSDEPLGHG